MIALPFNQIEQTVNSELYIELISKTPQTKAGWLLKFKTTVFCGLSRLKTT